MTAGNAARARPATTSAEPMGESAQSEDAFTSPAPSRMEPVVAMVMVKASADGRERRRGSIGQPFTKVFIWRMGRRIDATTNATPPPMRTIMIGSSKLVSAVTRVST